MCVCVCVCVGGVRVYRQGNFFFVRDAANNLCVRVANNFAVCFRACCCQFQLKKCGREGTRRERENAPNANEVSFLSSRKLPHPSAPASKKVNIP